MFNQTNQMNEIDSLENTLLLINIQASINIGICVEMKYNPI